MTRDGDPYSRFPTPYSDSSWLERWSKLAADQGTRAMDALRDGVAEAIVALGSGFLAQPANQALRARLQSGELSTQAYYQQLRRLVYRLIFLFVAEDRDLLLLPDTPPAVRKRYDAYYSLRRVREMAGALRGGPHTDLYRQVRQLFVLLRTGYPDLGLPGLGSFLFSARSTPDLDDAELANRPCWRRSGRCRLRWRTACAAPWTTATSTRRSWAASTNRCWNCTRRSTLRRGHLWAEHWAPGPSARPRAATTRRRRWWRICWTRRWSRW